MATDQMKCGTCNAKALMWSHTHWVCGACQASNPYPNGGGKAWVDSEPKAINWDEFDPLAISVRTEIVNFAEGRDDTWDERTIRVFSIDSIRARQPGQGAFGRLLERLGPAANVLVRATHLRFAKHLEGLGFTQVNRHLSQVDMLRMGE